ncbi:MAG: recombination mediator RecR, partial [Chitinophagales bacterium]
MDFPSKLIGDAVKEFTKLPGIGKKTALRLVLHLLKEETKNVEAFGETVIRMRQDIQFCQKCHNVSDNPVCSICLDLSRDGSVICVVENMRNVLAIENTHQYRGLYHVLGGVISPIDGIGPDNLHVDSLVDRVK